MSDMENKEQDEKGDVPPIHVISLGAGVQSSTMALMAAHGEITPMPVAGIFADTGDEPESVYKWLEWLVTQLPFPVNRVWKQYRKKRQTLSEASLAMHTTADGRKFSQTSIPFFTRNADGKPGKIVFRGCTRDFKLGPIRTAQRMLGEIKRGQKNVGVISWIGISSDEATRMKDSREPWCENRYPLIELRMTRQDCLRWMEAHHYPVPPRSACVYCPFHNNKEWRRLQIEEPKEFAKAVEFERLLQAAKSESGNFKTVPFLHRSLLPLDQIDFRSLEELGQGNMFENECEGMCGV
jgi:hypothetical protein